MTIEEFRAWAQSQGSVAKYTDGQYKGQCVSLINQYLARVYGIQAGAWGNAKDWATNANVLSYFDKVSSPQAGDIGISGATKTNPYGHIWIYLSPTQVLEQNGRVALRVTVNPPLFSPIAILRRKGTGSSVATIQNADNWYWRCNDTHWRIRGRELSRSTFNSFVGKDFLNFVEACSDDPEAQTVQHWQNVGKIAVTDKWDGQIYALQDQVKALNGRPTKEQLAELQAQADGLVKSLDDANKQVEKLKNERSADTELLDNAGNWLSKLFNRLFKKG